MNKITITTQKFVVAELSIHAQHVAMYTKVGKVYEDTKGNNMEMM